MSGTSERVRDILFREKLRESIKVDRQKVRPKKGSEKSVERKRMDKVIQKYP